ncbi:MAG: carboxypeptidase regulatory-like domain-containing protein [Methanophagales archaeon]|nr:carboxypeptidase regulatory-like domain-containing protein [Methanophagales archaeon]
MTKKVISYESGAIVLLTVFAMVTPASAQPTASSFGVNDAIGNPGTYVSVPVNITNVQNGPIVSVIFDVLYNNGVINVVGVQRGDLTSNWDSPSYYNFDWETRVTIVYDAVIEHAIQNGVSGSLVLLNFSVIGTPGSTSRMNLTGIQMSDTEYNVGTAPAKNGTFRVDAGAPNVTNPNANPGTIVADGVQESRLNVTAIDDIAIDVVTVNLTEIGGPAKKVMEKIEGTLYSTTTNASGGTTPRTYYLPVNATDLLVNSNNTEAFMLIVEASANGSLTGKITYTCNTTGIEGVEVNLTNLTGVVKTTTTNATGYYDFKDVTPGNYYMNASKSRFWDNSTDVTVSSTGATTEADMMLWLKGDLNNDGTPADPGDLAKMKDASVGKITPDWRYDLNNNGIFADPGDLAKMKDASVGKIDLI